MPKSFCESVGQQPFDWWAFLERAQRGEVSIGSEEHEAAADRASLWNTCMCGNQCESIPRHPSFGTTDRTLHDRRPVDNVLADYGYQFYEAIKDSDWEGAAIIGRKIEERAARILESMAHEQAR